MKREPNEAELKSRERIIKIINENCNGSQAEFAQRVGIGKSSVSQYVNGRNFPSNVRAGQIAHAFGLNPMWVMGFDVPKHASPAEMHRERLSRMVDNLMEFTDNQMRRQALYKIAEFLDHISDDGVAMLVDYAEVLASSKKYKK